MTTYLPFAQAVQRLRENEDRFDVWVNDENNVGFYTNRLGVNVETFPHLMARLSANYDALVADLLAARDQAVAAATAAQGYLTDTTAVYNATVVIRDQTQVIKDDVLAAQAIVTAAETNVLNAQAQINSIIGALNATLIVSGTEYTLASDALNLHILFTSDDPVTFTIPNYNTVPLEINRSFSFTQQGLGAVTVVTEDMDVILLHPADLTPNPRVQGSTVGMLHSSENLWVVSGDQALVV